MNKKSISFLLPLLSLVMSGCAEEYITIEIKDSVSLTNETIEVFETTNSTTVTTQEFSILDESDVATIEFGRGLYKYEEGNNFVLVSGSYIKVSLPSYAYVTNIWSELYEDVYMVVYEGEGILENSIEVSTSIIKGSNDGINREFILEGTSNSCYIYNPSDDAQAIYELKINFSAFYEVLAE